MIFSSRNLQNDMVPLFQAIRLMNESVLPEIPTDVGYSESSDPHFTQRGKLMQLQGLNPTRILSPLFAATGLRGGADDGSRDGPPPAVLADGAPGQGSDQGLTPSENPRVYRVYNEASGQRPAASGQRPAASGQRPNVRPAPGRGAHVGFPDIGRFRPEFIEGPAAA